MVHWSRMPGYKSSQALRCARCNRRISALPHGYINGEPYGERCYNSTVRKMTQEGKAFQLSSPGEYQKQWKKTSLHQSETMQEDELE